MTNEELVRAARHERDEWRVAHRELATALGATARGRDHVDALFVIDALKRAYGIVEITVLGDGSEVQIKTVGAGGYELRRIPREFTAIFRG
jgi:hypothetical protein